MTKDEALKLALEALEAADWYINQLEITLYSADDAGTHEDRLKVQQAITVMRLEIDALNMASKPALAEQPAQQGSTCSNALREQGKAYPRTCKKCGLGPCVELAQQALDKMAENAREQPAQKCSYPYCGCNSKAWCKVERNEAIDKMAENARELGLDYEPAQQEPVAIADGTFNHNCPVGSLLYTSPPAQRTWVGLTDEEISARAANFYSPEMYKRAVLWAQEKLKERNQ
jgi:hypothetical protein